MTEFKYGLATGEVVTNSDYSQLDNLFRDKSKNSRSGLRGLEEALGIVQETAGATPTDAVINFLGFDQLPNWQIIYNPTNPDLLLIGSSNSRPPTIEKAEGTIAIFRSRSMTSRGMRIVQPMARGKQPAPPIPVERVVMFDAFRAAGINSKSGKLAEVSYADKDSIMKKADNYTRPDVIELEHIGFSITTEEFPETVNDFLGKTYHDGSEVKNSKGDVIYRPYFFTLPMTPTEVGILFARELTNQSGRYYGSVITEAMAARFPQSRILRTHYDSVWAVRAGLENHQVFLGEDGGEASKAGLYSKINPETVSFGLGVANSWEVTLPKHLTSVI